MPPIDSNKHENKKMSQERDNAAFVNNVGNDSAKTKSNLIQIPSITLPKGVGAIKSIDEKFSVNAANGTAEASECIIADLQLIRFEWKREWYAWIKPDDICFVISADHYVKALINCEKQKKWMSRHCTIKELIATLSLANFIRLNRFYLLNCNHFSHINEKEKLFYFNDDFYIPVPHRISTHLRHLIKTAYT